MLHLFLTDIQLQLLQVCWSAAFFFFNCCFTNCFIKFFLRPKNITIEHPSQNKKHHYQPTILFKEKFLISNRHNNYKSVINDETQKLRSQLVPLSSILIYHQFLFELQLTDTKCSNKDHQKKGEFSFISPMK